MPRRSTAPPDSPSSGRQIPLKPTKKPPGESTKKPVWNAITLFKHHDHHFVANLLRGTRENVLLSQPEGAGVAHARGSTSPPSYLAMCDPTNIAGEIVQNYGEQAWQEISEAFKSGGITPPSNLNELPPEHQIRVQKLQADLWFWKLHSMCVPVPHPSEVLNAQAALNTLDNLRKGKALFGPFVPQQYPEVIIHGGIITIFGRQLKLSPQQARILQLAFRPDGLSFRDARTELRLGTTPPSGITARVAKLVKALATETKDAAFTVEVETEGKCIRACVRSKPVATRKLPKR